MTTDIADITEFLRSLDALKLVNRQSYIASGVRLENSAEHSWHLALACWAFAEILPESYDQEKLLKLALIHDLGEIDAGDTFLYANERSDAHAKELKCIERISTHSGNTINDLLPLWKEQEYGHSKETKLLKVVDRLLPFMHNINSEGRAWKENRVKKSQVQAKHTFIKNELPEVYNWFKKNLDLAVEKGWLIDE